MGLPPGLEVLEVRLEELDGVLGDTLSDPISAIVVGNFEIDPHLLDESRNLRKALPVQTADAGGMSKRKHVRLIEYSIIG
jgi:hypothetical protein